jgi:uncharacterized protein (TIRG00374 family)
MENDSVISKNFSGWKIGLAIFISISIASYLLYSALSETQFIKVEDGNGTYEWLDANKNGKVDTDLSIEFQKVAKGDYRQLNLYDAINEINWTTQSYFYFLLAILLMVSRDFFYILRIRLLTKNELTWKASTYVILIWEFASALTPGVVGGAAVAMFILNKEKIPLGRSTAIVFITAMMDNLFYIVLIPIVFLFISTNDLFPKSMDNQEGLYWFFWLGFSIIFAACLFLFLSIFVWPKLASKFLKAIFSLPILRRWKNGAIQTGADIEVTSAVMRKEPLIYWLKVFGATLMSWISRYLVINALLQAFIGFNMIEHMQLLGKQLVLWLFMLISPTPGGSGVAEYAFSELLAPYASSAVLLAGLAIVWRLISYFPYLFIGAIILPKWLRKK